MFIFVFLINVNYIFGSKFSKIKISCVSTEVKIFDFIIIICKLWKNFSSCTFCKFNSKINVIFYINKILSIFTNFYLACVNNIWHYLEHELVILHCHLLSKDCFGQKNASNSRYSNIFVILIITSV